MGLPICALLSVLPILGLIILGLKVHDIRKTLNEYMETSNERAEQLLATNDELINVQILTISNFIDESVREQFPERYSKPSS